jgi:hypothetical protein
MPRRLATLITVTVLILCGCGTDVQYTALVRTPRVAARSPQSVKVYLSSPPKRPHRDVGLLEAEQMSEFSWDNTRDMINKMRETAARVGCDAIFVKAVGSNTDRFLGVTDSPSSTKTVTATCIRYGAEEDDDDES